MVKCWKFNDLFFEFEDLCPGENNNRHFVGKRPYQLYKQMDGVGKFLDARDLELTIKRGLRTDFCHELIILTDNQFQAMTDPQANKNLKKINFLDQEVRVCKAGNFYTGKVFYFSPNALILFKQNTYEMINMDNFNQISIEIVEQDESHEENLKQKLNQ